VSDGDGDGVEVPDEDEFDSVLWNEVCDDLDCDDTNYHATVEELLARIRDASRDLDVLAEAEDIVFQAGVADGVGDSDSNEDQ
jgi:hypothetical protein